MRQEGLFAGRPRQYNASPGPTLLIGEMDMKMNGRPITAGASILILIAILVSACRSPALTGPESSMTSNEPAVAQAGDPAKAAVPLPAAAGWDAFLVMDNGDTGVWTVDAFRLFPQYGTPEIGGLDDQGRCLVLILYSGKRTPMILGHDGRWLGGLAHGDIDPRVDGCELYTGGQKGNLYQLTFHPHGAADFRLIAHLPGREIHTIVAGDVDPAQGGKELLLFTRPGGLYRVSPTGKDGTFETVHLEDLPGRVRNAVVLPERDGSSPEIATVSRTGRLELLTMTSRGPRWSTLYEDSMGMGRIVCSTNANDPNIVLYARHEDGRIMRFEKPSSGDWSSETIYRGPQGPRGIAAGAFCSDRGTETVAVFGYSSEVVLLSRRGKEPWSEEVIFKDRDKGHSLAVAEVDGRNATPEIIGSGYGGRIFVLARPPGYGVKCRSGQD